MIIEFYGLPGSGKTSIAQALSDSQEDFEYLHTSSRWEIVRTFPLFFVMHPFISIFWIKEIFLNSPASLFRYKLHRVLVSLIQYKKADSVKNMHALIDEGMLQRILSVYETPQTEGKIIRCIKNIPHVDLVIITNYDKREFQRYFETRAPGARDLASWMDAARANDKLIREFLPASGIKFINLDKGKNIEEISSQLVKYLS